MSDIIRGLDNSLAVFNIGLHTLSHIYKLSYYITKNVETAGCYTQKGVYCYLEYIEQMNRTNSLHNLNNTDAVLFVYDKTLTEIYNPENNYTNVSHEQNMFSNIISLNHPEMREQNWKTILENLSHITQTILWTTKSDISYLQRLNITHEYLPKYLNIYADHIQPDTLEIVKMISVIQDKMVLATNDYIELIDTILKTYKKTVKSRTIHYDDKYLVVSIHLAGISISDVASSEYGKQMGWKSRVDFIRWLVA
jgi:hypothetical protein